MVLLGATVLVYCSSCGNHNQLEYKSPFIGSCDSQLVLTQRHTHPEQGFSVMVPDSWVLDITHPDSLGIKEGEGFVAGLTPLGKRMTLDSMDQVRFMRALNITQYEGTEESLLNQHAREMEGALWKSEPVERIESGRMRLEEREYVWTLYREITEIGVYYGIFFLTKGKGTNDYMILQLGFNGEKDWERELCRMQPILEGFEF